MERSQQPLAVPLTARVVVSTGVNKCQVSQNRKAIYSRRDFIKLAAGAAAAGPFFLFPTRSLASQKTLKIAKWAHFVPEFDLWFESMARDWGRQNDTRIIVDEIPVEKVHAVASTEIKASQGHDVFIFPWPPAEFHQHVNDHGDIYRMVASKYGAIPQLAHRSTFNFKNKTYFAFADFWSPSPLHFFQDAWAQIGMPLGPVHYGSLYGGGKKLRDQLGIPCGLAFSPTLEGNVTLHTMLYAFRAWILDGNGNVLFLTRMFPCRRGTEIYPGAVPRDGNAGAALRGRLRRQRAGQCWRARHHAPPMPSAFLRAVEKTRS